MGGGAGPAGGCAGGIGGGGGSVGGDGAKRPNNPGGADGDGASGGLLGPRTECNRCKDLGFEGVLRACIQTTGSSLNRAADLSLMQRLELGFALARSKLVKLSCHIQFDNLPKAITHSLSIQNIHPCQSILSVKKQCSHLMLSSQGMGAS